MPTNVIWQRVSTQHALPSGKTIPLEMCTGPEGSRTLRFPDFKTIGTWRWLGCQIYAPAAFTLQEIFLALISVRGWVDPQGHNAIGNIMSMKNSNDTIGNQTRDRLTCSAVPQPTAPPAACPITVTYLSKLQKYSYNAIAYLYYLILVRAWV